MNDDQIRAAAPSVFATHPSAKVSDKYAYLPSYHVVRNMRALGFEAVKVREGTKKAPDGRQYALHEIRFRKAGTDWASQTKELGSLVPEAVFRNSHDRTSGADMRAGMTRLVCLNGMTISEADMRFSVRHVGKNVQDSFHTAVQAITSQFGRIVEVAQEWSEIDLDGEQQRQFAKAALEARGSTLEVEQALILWPKRPLDENTSLWSIFNRAQENLSLGGLHGRSKAGGYRQLPPIRSLAIDADFNHKLWHVASQFAELARSAPSSVVG
jgi:hypothetical protein